MDDRSSAGNAESRAAKLFARAGTIHERSARLLHACGHEAAAREAERLAASARDRVTESAAVAQMYALARKLRGAARLSQLIEQALDGAIALLGADLGNVQLVHPQTNALRIVAQRGFGPGFLAHFAVVDDEQAACGRAVRTRSQLVVADVNADAGFAPHRAIAAASGFRAVQSTPLIDRAGRLHGVLSTHFAQPHRPPEHQLRLMQTYARLLADAIARMIDARHPLPTSANRLASPPQP
jgi:hypothetical protein